MAKEITLDLVTSNLGPHEALSAKIQTSSIEIGIYANNGSGKTFISRAFRLLANENPKPEDSSRLLTVGKNEGFFKIEIKNTKEPGINRDAEFSLKRNHVPVIKNNSNYIFRTFNEDYVKENLDISKYKPNGQIEGYILGKEKIDLSNEKLNLSEKISALEKADQKLNSKIAQSLNELDKLDIRKNTTEYNSFRYANLINPLFQLTEKESFEVLVEKYNKLKSLPANITDLYNTNKIRETKTISYIEEFLSQEFKRSQIAEDFKNKVKSKQDFIEIGVGLAKKDKTICPFCEQTLNDHSLQLIDHYTEYLAEAEAQHIKRASDLFSQLKSDRKDYGEVYKAFLKLQNDFLQLQQYLPSLHDTILANIIDIKDIDQHFIIIQKALEAKKIDISKPRMSPEVVNALVAINNWIKKSNDAIDQNQTIVKIFNERKNNLSAEKLDLNRRLCKSKFNSFRNIETESITQIASLKSEINSIQQDIKTKEDSEKISKKDKVTKTLELLLTRFFGTKYSFDSGTFCIKFGEHILENNASDVLSTGEKSIVAFCYFIAESHKYIEKEADYNKLFFVIDDPISSQDFHFVYATAQLIRNLNSLFAIPRLRIILLTHNLEFMSILIRNKIIGNKYVITRGILLKLGNELIMPYEEHLRDIYSISQGIGRPSHTTANSIRHVLETINRFVSPELELEKFCERIDGFANNNYLYSLMHDGSHGILRAQKPVTEIMVKEACDVVTNYILRDFGGQLKIITV
ncbi:AAA family ATPase [Dyadobacter sp. BHUBP1]|uniref:AAA family ATPase n=1 Tax=Dyadobacter sp. BHUBP1 TaxID=3424178 RepID=UPI003D34FE3F